MDADHADARLAAVAAAIADPARARMLCSLLDGCARTATELAALADIGASSASAHFAHLRAQGLVELAVQGKHRYYQLADADVAQALEALLVVAGVPRVPFKPATPGPLCHARTCYDHMAGTVAVRLHDAMLAQRWLQPDGRDYRVTPAGAAALAAAGWTRLPGHPGRHGGADQPGAGPGRHRPPAAPPRLSLPGLERAPPAPGRRAGRGAAAVLPAAWLGRAAAGFARLARHRARRTPLRRLVPAARPAGRRGVKGARAPLDVKIQ